MKDELTGLDLENLISYEVMSGWPIYKMTFRELLKSLGAIKDNGMIGFELDDPILDMYPRKLHIDAMGYGVEEQWFTEANTDRESYLNFFVETELSNENLSAYVEEHRNYARKILENGRQLETNSE